MKRVTKILLALLCPGAVTGAYQANRLRQLAADSTRLERQLSVQRQQLARTSNPFLATASPDNVEPSAFALTVSSTGDATFDEEMRSLLARLNRLKTRLAREPALQIPELRFLDDSAWFAAAKDLPEAPSDLDERNALGDLRSEAVGGFYDLLASALHGYLKASNQQLPENLSQLKPYFVTEVDDALLSRYELIEHGSARFISSETTIIAQKKSTIVDPEVDAAIRVITLGSN